MNTPTAFLNDITRILSDYLSERLPKLGGGVWWEKLVLKSLSYPQRDRCRREGYTELADLDLASLLKVFQNNFDLLCNTDGDLSFESKPLFFELSYVRNRAAHIGAKGLGLRVIERDLQTMMLVLEALKYSEAVYYGVAAAWREALQRLNAICAEANSLPGHICPATLPA